MTTFVNDANGNVLHQETRNSLGTLVSQTDNTYDPDGNLLTTTNGDGNVTVYTYDGAGRKTSETVASGTPQAATTSYVYDADGNLSKVTDPDGNHTFFGYDADGQQTSLADTFGHVSTTTYDDAGRKTSSTDRDGRRIVYGYDGAGRLNSE